MWSDDHPGVEGCLSEIIVVSCVLHPSGSRVLLLDEFSVLHPLGPLHCTLLGPLCNTPLGTLCFISLGYLCCTPLGLLNILPCWAFCFTDTPLGLVY